MDQLVIQGKNFQEIKSKVRDLAMEFGFITDQMTLPMATSAEPSYAAGAVEEPVEKTPAKRGRKPKAAAEVEETKTAPLDDLTGTVETKTYTKADAIKALETVNKTHGLERCRDLLSQYGAAKMGDLKPELYGDFIMSCTHAVNPSAAN